MDTTATITRVWVEAILPIPIPSDPDDPEKAIEQAATAAMPASARILNALTLDAVDRVMSQEAADMRELVGEVRHQLKVAAGAFQGGIVDLNQAESMVRNVLAYIDQALPTLEPVG